MIWDWYHKTLISNVCFTRPFLCWLFLGEISNASLLYYGLSLLNFDFHLLGAQTITSASDYEKKSGSGDRLCHTCRVTMVLWPWWRETDTYVNHFYASTDKTTDKQTLLQLLDSAHLVRRADGSLRRDNDDKLVQSAVGFVCNRALMSS